MESPDGIAGVFDRAADTYDAVGVPWVGPIATRLVAELDVRPGTRVLDIGCGRGAALGPLALATGPTGHALGIDLAPRMVELTARDLAHLPQVEVRVADARAPELPPASFDVVAASLVLFFLPEPAAALRAWTELAVHGGRLGVTTLGEKDPGWTAVDQLFGPHLPPELIEARSRALRGPYASDAGVERLFSDAGLTDVRTVVHSVDAVFGDPEQFVAFSWSHGQRSMWEAVPEAARPGLQEEILGALEEQRDASGRITFRQAVRHTLGVRP
ncbi:class I SAM-dependent methyltransferase [Cellulomonas fengjieae]|uniref:class I SAM-dependent methyltransferase n=1 Tax=Cellulomonas fengjieae TaxID=2819978 RepID=UPI001AAFEB05|nr:methyltransferase domain-containing protein [Cellulomonas fengjieae]MBO3102925.1 methyltransferase domain-containing protein [Cellulomonas fengjieae]